jgi:hypothetical protein
MERTEKWPWNIEEEVQWKANLEERNDEVLEQLIETASEGGMSGSRYVLDTLQKEEPAERGAPEKYLVTT